MRIISWNINSIRARQSRLFGVLQRHEPDVVCLQETKVTDNEFPVSQMNAAGYRTVTYGQLSYNGVAILLRDPTIRGGLSAFAPNRNSNSSLNTMTSLGVPTDVRRGFPEDPVPDEARVISACIGGIRIVNVYVVNGVDEDNDQFKIKQRWMAAFGNWLKNLPTDTPLLVIGDFNVAPDDRDVFDPALLKNRIHCTVAERAWFSDLCGEKLQDLLRATTNEAGVYTWWPYRKGAFDRGWGLRFDLALGDSTVVNRTKRVYVDQEERRPSANEVPPSDHAPVIVDLE